VRFSTPSWRSREPIPGHVALVAVHGSEMSPVSSRIRGAALQVPCMVVENPLGSSLLATRSCHPATALVDVRRSRQSAFHLP